MKIGDRVTVKSEGLRAGTDAGLVRGGSGILLSIDDGEGYLIAFDDWKDGHGAQDNEWFVMPEDLVDSAELLPIDAKKRKQYPIGTGVLDYFSAAIAEVSHVSYIGNEQHNPGEPLHWARGKSMDQEDTMLRHFMERGKLDSDGVRHSAKMCWRALAILQLELEAEGFPVARGAK